MLCSPSSNLLHPGSSHFSHFSPIFLSLSLSGANGRITGRVASLLNYGATDNIRGDDNKESLHVNGLTAEFVKGVYSLVADIKGSLSVLDHSVLLMSLQKAAKWTCLNYGNSLNLKIKNALNQTDVRSR